jgi:membrane-anchored protein YejM (alkaline phosphatase superfamily)
VYFPVKAKRRLAALGWIDPAEVEKRRLMRQASSAGGDRGYGQLLYPLHPLQCSVPDDELPNIAIILIDALRPDKIGVVTTPAIQNFAARSQQFTNHYSGGNSSRMGIFSLFYGLPSTYWQNFYDLQHQPVLLEELLGRDYEVAAFSSVGFGSPAQIDRTIFSAVGPERRHVPVTGTPRGEKNPAMTKMWRDWLSMQSGSKRPYFGFLYYDPDSTATEVSAAIVAKGEAATSAARYMQGIAAIDAEVTDVLASIEAVDNGRETLVIITSDHGYEFDELGLGYIGHASNFGPWQLRSTLLIAWPGREPHTYTHRSAHQDLPGTLLQEVFGCSNEISDYSSGGNLFAAEDWSWIISGSYTSHAIVEPDQLLVTYPGGFIELLGPDYRPDKNLKLKPALLESAMQEMKRFYR